MGNYSGRSLQPHTAAAWSRSAGKKNFLNFLRKISEKFSEILALKSDRGRRFSARQNFAKFANFVLRADVRKPPG